FPGIGRGNGRSPFTGRFPFLASPLNSWLANASGRIEFIIVLFMDWSFASGCSPPRLSTTQLPSATDTPVLLSDRDFHPIVGAHFQAHFSRHFVPGYDRPVPPGRLADLKNVQTPGPELKPGFNPGRGLKAVGGLLTMCRVIVL